MHLLAEAPAKVNLSLLVGPRRPDGYHELFSVFVPVSLCDRLTFTLSVGGADEIPGTLEVDVKGTIDQGGVGESNLAVRALRAVEALAGRAISGRVTIEKHIPVGAGMGGGSSDGAAALRAAARLLALEADVHVEPSVLRDLARSLGADVPFFLEGGPALARGVGDILEPIQIPPLPLVVLLPERQLATKEVYAELDGLRSLGHIAETGESFPGRAAEAATRWRDLEKQLAHAAPGYGDAGVAVAAALENDLEAAAFSLMPDLGSRKQSLRATGALGALMSGSGPTFFGVCRTVKHAQEVCSCLTTWGYQALVVETA